jgi:TRAP-type C4-dicarboxylate transport system substrate-binding protein
MLAPPVAAQGIVLRMAAIAPEGTAWARELKALSREVETATAGTVRLRWYLGGIAGDEHTAIQRIRRGQLDGFAGASSCLELAPTMGVARVLGIVNTRAEGLALLNRLRADIDRDFAQHGFVELSLAGFGNDVLFLRREVRTLADIRKLVIWVWRVDEIVRAQMTAMGMSLLPGHVDELAALYDSGRIDGMFVIPAAALAFQWTTHARYFLDLRTSYLPGCMAIAQHSFDQLGLAEQQALRDAAAKFARRFEEAGARDEALLVSRLLERQGLKRLAASDSLRAELFSSARESRAGIPAGLVPPALLNRALMILADIRADHSNHVTEAR